MNKILIYDNTIRTPQDISNLLGVNRFSDVYYRKRSLEKWMSDIAGRAGLHFYKLEDRNSRQAIDRLGLSLDISLTVVYVPACMAFGCPEEEAAIFLKKISHTRAPLRVQLADGDLRPVVAVMTGASALSLLQKIGDGEDPYEVIGDMAGELNVVEDDAGMIDLRDPLHFTDYLTSNFDVRFFNSVQTVNDFVVVKYSTEKQKLRREFKYYSLLPQSMRMFFVEPYDFREEQSRVSYRMERMFVPDMALQWIHGSLDELNFSRFLNKVFYFLSIRKVRKVDSSVVRVAHTDAFRTKVTVRIEQLKADTAYQRIAAYVSPNFGSIDNLVERYFRLLDGFERNNLAEELCIGHGDLCFSNILYSKTTGLMRFIDPRGAENEDDIYMHPLYDVAKLSHSVIGRYDFINYGLYRLEVSPTLDLTLHVDPGPPAWARQLFETKLKEHGYDPMLIRLYEASLFISMLPLHIDSPRKVLAFMVNADKILGEIESKLNWKRT